MSNKEKSIKLLIVDDDDVVRDLYETWLREIEGVEYKVLQAESGEKGLKVFADHEVDCILLDFFMMEKDGFAFMDSMKQKFFSIPPIIFISSTHDDIIIEDALKQGAKTFLDKKGLTAEKLHKAITKAIS